MFDPYRDMLVSPLWQGSLVHPPVVSFCAQIFFLLLLLPFSFLWDFIVRLNQWFA
jgi:hypothetical protein